MRDNLYIGTIDEPLWAFPSWVEPRKRATPLTPTERYQKSQGPEIKAKRRAFAIAAWSRIQAGLSTEEAEQRRAKAEGLYSQTTYIKDIHIRHLATGAW